MPSYSSFSHFYGHSFTIITSRNLEGTSKERASHYAYLCFQPFPSSLLFHLSFLILSSQPLLSHFLLTTPQVAPMPGPLVLLPPPASSIASSKGAVTIPTAPNLLVASCHFSTYPSDFPTDSLAGKRQRLLHSSAQIPHCQLGWE